MDDIFGGHGMTVINEGGSLRISLILFVSLFLFVFERLVSYFLFVCKFFSNMKNRCQLTPRKKASILEF